VRRKDVGQLIAKGYEGLPFAWRAVLCEGQDDVGPVLELADRMSLELRRKNIAVIDCGSGGDLPDYIWFCAERGIQYLAVQDADQSKLEAAGNVPAVRGTRKSRGGGRAEFPENLEASFNVPKRRPSLVPDAVRVLFHRPGSRPCQCSNRDHEARRRAAGACYSNRDIRLRPALVLAPRAVQPATASQVSAAADPGELTATG
jgi:hypothetical protein